MLRVGNTEPDGNRGVGNCANTRHDGIEISGDARTRSRNAQRAYTVNEAFRITGNRVDAFLRRRRNHADKIHTVSTARASEFLLFLKGDVGENQPIHANLCRTSAKLLDAVVKHHIGVGHEHKGRVDGFTQVGHHIKHPVGGGARLKRAHIGRLDYWPFCRRVRKRNAQLDNGSTCPCKLSNNFLGGFQIWVAAGNKGNKGFSALKGGFDAGVTH